MEGIDVIIDLHLGSQFAKNLGLGDIKEWDASTAATTAASDSSSIDVTSDVSIGLEPHSGEELSGGGGKAKKKNNKKKKKK